MKGVRVTRLLEGFSLKELDKLHVWLENELDGRQSSMFRLFLALKEARTTDQWEQDLIWSNIFPRKPFNVSQLRRLAEQLIQWLEEYIAIEAFRKDRMACDSYFIQGLNQRKQIDLFPFFLKKVKKRWKKNPQRDAEYHQLMFKLESELLIHENLVSSKRLKYKGDIQLRYNQAFESWMILLRLKTSLLLHNHSMKYADAIPQLFEKETVTLARKDVELQKMPTVQLSIQLYDIIHDQLQDVGAFFKKLEANKKVLGEQMYVTFFHIAFNMIITKANNTGEKRYYIQLLDIYEWGIQSKTFFDGEFLLTSHYKNIIAITQKLAIISTDPGSKKQYLTRAYNYLENLKKYLPLAEREEAYTVYKAIYHFANKEFQIVRKTLVRRSFLNTSYEIQGRLHGIKARYELGEGEDLVREIITFKAFLQGQAKLEEQNKNSYLNLLKFLMKFVKAGPNTNFQKLTSQLEKTSPLNDKKWLLDKLSELENNILK